MTVCMYTVRTLQCRQSTQAVHTVQAEQAVRAVRRTLRQYKRPCTTASLAMAGLVVGTAVVLVVGK